MITDSFDPKTEQIITPAAFYGEQQHLCNVCIVTFSRIIYENILRTFSCEKVAEMNGCNESNFLHLFTYHGKKIAFYLSGTGSTLAATDVIETNWLTGADTFVMFGSAGSLNKAKTQGRYVIPTAAYRDEGMSYHYAPPADYIDIPGADTVARIFDDLNVPYIKGRVWTTDAFYRETRGQVKKRSSEGCLAVEMELAGVQAVCDFHGFRLYDFLMTGDVLDQPEYSHEDLHNANHSLDKFTVALEIALRV